MSSFLEPDPALLAFLFYKKFLHLELLGMLALLRVILGAGIARWIALLTLMLCLGGVATTFAPLLAWNQGALYVSAARFMTTGGGMAALLLPSCVFLICFVTRRARWRWLDWIHCAMLVMLLGLWWWTS